MTDQTVEEAVVEVFPEEYWNAEIVTALFKVIRAREDLAYERAALVSQRHGNVVITKVIRQLKHETTK